MIAKENLKNLLRALGFQEDGEIFIRNGFPVGAVLKVDFTKQELSYPEDKGLKINERQTCNFSANENFVVFECVVRLLEKGYKPAHIELEPKWKVGHGASGGRADILIKDNDGKSLLIIECKTAGKEFNDAWKDMLNNGGQLFSYAQQETSTEYLCLYASDFSDNKVESNYRFITLKDNEKLLEEKKDKNPLSYKEAHSVKEMFSAWKETYAQDYATKGIFEPDIQAYHIGKLKYTEAELKIVGAKDIQPKYHEFATILRQHNVSGRENAFDKLVNLFLCKIVDEKNNKNDLKFYWKGIAYDSFFDLIDRLQKLYKDGMDSFMKEPVTYIDDQTIKDTFKFFKNDPDATRDKILEYFREQKYFTNNDFAFIDVHNEDLFYQNAAVLLKIVLMLQDIRLNGDQQNQFLGDMFEFFLDQGFKQSEGQFFTPMPITKYILMSLPLENIIKENQHAPKVLDFACGAGHFLNELAAQIKPFVTKHKRADIKKYYSQIYGVEKEYRLSKVAKVSSFMYSQDDINIIYADALATQGKLRQGKFQILVSNPPYSVKGFLETLPERDREKFLLINSIDAKSYPTNNSIETFFIERAKHLLAPGGVAGIIVPSSILSNSDGTYTATREIILKYFDIIAISELGSGTFGKTGTNTVILFLRRKSENPAPADHFKNRVDSWFIADTKKNEIFEDGYLIKKYCEHIEIDFNDYKTLLQNSPAKKLFDYDVFKEYKKDFDGSAEIKNLQAKKFFRDLKPAEQKEELEKRFTVYLKEKEKEKVYFFVLAFTQPNKVVIVKSPTDNKEQKKFLGYEWSAAKGNEGIKYLGGTLEQIETPLYNPLNRYDNQKINYYIQKNFVSEPEDIPEDLQKFISATRLVDMLDFSRKDFSKQISLTSKKSFVIETKWELINLESFIKTIESGSRPSGGVGNINSGALSLGGEHIHNSNGTVDLSTPKYVPKEYYMNSSKGILRENDILLCKDGALTGKVAFLRKEISGSNAMVNEHVFILRCDDLIKQKYLFAFLFSRDGQNILKLNITGAAQGGLNQTNLASIKIPLPPKEVQEKIVAECEAVDKEVERAQDNIDVAKYTIIELINKIYNSQYDFREIDKISLHIQYGISQAMNEAGKGYKIFRMQEIINGKLFDGGKMKYVEIDDDGFAKYKLSKGDILFNRTNSIEHVGRTGIFLLDGDYCFASYLVRIAINKELAAPSFVNAIMNSQQFQSEAKSKASKAINQANINANTMKNIKIPVPPIELQKQFVEEIEKLEEKIREAQNIINSSSSQKQAILKKYL